MGCSVEVAVYLGFVQTRVNYRNCNMIVFHNEKVIARRLGEKAALLIIPIRLFRRLDGHEVSPLCRFLAISDTIAPSARRKLKDGGSREGQRGLQDDPTTARARISGHLD